MYENEGLQLAQASIMVNPDHRGQVNARERAIRCRGVALCPNLVPSPMQFSHFCATRFAYQLHFSIPNDHMDLTAVIQSNDENEKLAFDSFI